MITLDNRLIALALAIFALLSSGFSKNGDGGARRAGAAPVAVGGGAGQPGRRK